MLFLIILLLTVLSGYVLPWWVAVIITFAASFYFGNKPGIAFISGFGGMAIAWIIMALIKSIPNDNLLATRVAHLFFLPNWIVLLLVTALIGGLIGGMAALSGTLVKGALKK